MYDSNPIHMHPMVPNALSPRSSPLFIHFLSTISHYLLIFDPTSSSSKTFPNTSLSYHYRYSQLSLKRVTDIGSDARTRLGLTETCLQVHSPQWPDHNPSSNFAPRLEPTTAQPYILPTLHQYQLLQSSCFHHASKQTLVRPRTDSDTTGPFSHHRHLSLC